LRYLCEMILELAEKYAWRLQAWAVFPNHYHIVGLSSEPVPTVGENSRTPNKLTEFTRHLHSVTAIEVNRSDQTPGRQVWFQYRDTPVDL